MYQEVTGRDVDRNIKENKENRDIKGCQGMYMKLRGEMGMTYKGYTKCIN